MQNHYDFFRCFSFFCNMNYFLLFLQTSRKSNLVQHRLTHSKEKPHQCEICGQSFSLAKNMRRHARQHDSNATIYQCKVGKCNFKSLRSDKYIEHMKKNHADMPTPMPMGAGPTLLGPQGAAPTSSNQITSSTDRNRSVLETVSTNSRLLNQTASELNIKTETQNQAEMLTKTNTPHPTLPRPSLLTTSPFNTISPPNKTVVDTFEEPNFPEAQFDEAIILAATASEDDFTSLVSPLL